MLAGVNEATHSLNLNLAVCYDDDDDAEVKPETSTSPSQIILPICMHSPVEKIKHYNVS